MMEMGTRKRNGVLYLGRENHFKSRQSSRAEVAKELADRGGRHVVFIRYSRYEFSDKS